EIAFSDNCGTPTGACTFGPPVVVSVVNPQGEPPGYNRARATILNAPYIFVDRGSDDGVFTSREQAQAGFGNVYITYFSGKTPFGSTPITAAADIFLSTSTTNGTTFGPPVKVNDDNTNTVHVFPSVQANKKGDVYLAWIDRRQDPAENIFNDTYAAVSKDQGLTFGHNKLQTTVSTSWFTRADARPNYGDYNSSELLGFNQFVTIWADGRFPPGTFTFDRPPFNPCPPEPAVCDPPPVERLAATPDVIFTIAQGLGVGNDPNPDR
ncbi:MAG TPA: sialidase family protein, partial [Gemmatimonadales bacterium]|nr:sialidase family protein [Gemmatimonadales bacterium]